MTMGGSGRPPSPRNARYHPGQAGVVLFFWSYA
jgi:hypothetical protein